MSQNLNKDTVLIAIAYDIDDKKHACDFKECPKFGWTNFTMGYQSEDAAIMHYTLCLEHMSEILSSLSEKFLKPVTEILAILDKQEWES